MVCLQRGVAAGHSRGVVLQSVWLAGLQPVTLRSRTPPDRGTAVFYDDPHEHARRFFILFSYSIGHAKANINKVSR
jgi:hypothetical protein